MAQKFRHQGASSGNTTYFRTAKCIYSGEKKLYDLSGKEWTRKDQDNLDMRFMQRDCQCKNCVYERKRRAKLVRALMESDSTESLRALGYR